MEQHEIDTFIAMAVAQYGRQHEYTQVENFKAHRWVQEAMKFAYELGVGHGRNGPGLGLDPWEHDDDIPF